MFSKIFNTEFEPRPEWLGGRNPQAIENQEAEGQKQLTESSQLPIKVNSPRGVVASEKYSELGITVIGQSENDRLFLDVTLPEGWRIEATDHSMWSRLIDAQGKEVAMIFYKAAFYDREAFINFSE